MSCWRLVLLYGGFLEVAGRIRFSDLFNGLEDSCKLTYLAFFVCLLL